jgi:hypothetical protein
LREGYRHRGAVENDLPPPTSAELPDAQRYYCYDQLNRICREKNGERLVKFVTNSEEPQKPTRDCDFEYKRPFGAVTFGS